MVIDLSLYYGFCFRFQMKQGIAYAKKQWCCKLFLASRNMIITGSVILAFGFYIDAEMVYKYVTIQ
jgi:hypothetical protein